MFGTDGIRAFSYKEPLVGKTLIKIGYAYGVFLKKKDNLTSNVFFSKDTRKSSDYIEKNLIKGVNLADLTAIKLGVLPTSSLSIFTTKYPYSAGMMITASHNDYRYNGIKFINTIGEKISTDNEKEMLKILKKEVRKTNVRIKNINYKNSFEEYTNEIVKKFDNLKFKRFKFAIDLSNGSSFRATSSILGKLKINFKAISISPNGFNINRNCGVENLKKISNYVKRNKLDFGVAIDGDADRIIFVDKQGINVEGDKIITFIASKMLRKGNELVTTIMTNNILETNLKRRGISIIRTDVGDKNISFKMKEKSALFGAENSGHYIFKDYLNTSDANITLILILKMLSENRIQMDTLSKMELNPNVLKSFYIKKKDPIDKIPKIQNFIRSFKNRFESNSYINIRYSGTEDKIRILIQYKDIDAINKEIDKFKIIVDELNNDKT